MWFWKTTTSTLSGNLKAGTEMAVQTREEIMDRLSRSMERIARVRRAAQLEAIIRAGGEPAPTPPPSELGPPGPEFRGQPPRSGPTPG